MGSLNDHYLFWKDTLQANQFVLNVISSGYRLPLFTNPLPANLINNASAYKHSLIVEQAINKLLKTGALTVSR